MTSLVPLPLTGDRLADFVLATLGDDEVGAGGAWTLGVEGAIAEMAGPGTGSSCGGPGGRSRPAPPGARCASSSPTRSAPSPTLTAAPGRRSSSPCPGHRCRRRRRRPLPSSDPIIYAIDPAARDQILVDLGLGRRTASFAVRTAEPDVLDLLHGAVGRTWQDLLATCGGRLVARSPTRVVRTAIARAEVHAHIPRLDERSPDGPPHPPPAPAPRARRDLPAGFDLPRDTPPRPTGTRHADTGPSPSAAHPSAREPSDRGRSRPRVGK